MFQELFSFNGRISRSTYLTTLILCILLNIILRSIINDNNNSDTLLVAYIPLIWISLAQSAKREHDLGFSGWWQLFPFRVFWLIFLKGEPESNQYGENPFKRKNQNTLDTNDYLFIILIMSCVLIGLFEIS
ncbi:putative membrane protein [Pedobacter glucosidilyticus]|nr:DUF805 domain-containing protein [Pedobacter glucosidilyticus]KHJ37218.1 putative membrane protein [Pedobacter glucosidilyticus]